MANFIAVLCARYKMLGAEARANGMGGAKLTAYASAGVHRCVPGALDMAGLGANALRKIPVDKNFRMDLDALQAAIAEDRAAGFTPFLIVGTAGSVDVGAFDDLHALAEIARENRTRGSMSMPPSVRWPHSRPRTRRSSRASNSADSVAFDFHKWAQVTYDAGCVLVRDPDVHFATFAQQTNYLAAGKRGLAGGEPWPCDLGPDLSRGFRALKVWMTLSAYGSAQLGGVVRDHLRARPATRRAD